MFINLCDKLLELHCKEEWYVPVSESCTIYNHLEIRLFNTMPFVDFNNIVLYKTKLDI